MSEQRSQHWQAVYDTKHHTDVSWYQSLPERSLQLIGAAGIADDAPIIDVGGGASTLVDHLLAKGHRDVTVLDIAASAFEQTRQRLGAAAEGVDWIVTDVTAFAATRQYALWHDRAVLHFLTEAADRERYVAALRRALAPGGHAVIATFAADGPTRCSGLDVRRYSVEMMQDLLGPEFVLLADGIDEHRTPGGGTQRFLYTHWQRSA